VILPSGSRGILQFAISRLEPFEGDDREIEKAIGLLRRATSAPLWIDDFHVDVEKGGDVFDDVEKAIRDLVKIDGVLADENAKGDEGKERADDDEAANVRTPLMIAASISIDRMVEATRKIATKAHQESLAGVTLDPKNQEEVNEKQEDAQEQIEEGDEELTGGKPDKAVEHFRKAWEKTQESIEEQAKEPKAGGKGK
jgi:hypothetical protein